MSEEKSLTPGIDQLREHAQRLLQLLDDPHPGLFTWREGLHNRIQEIKQYGLSPLDHAAPKLLEACKAWMKVESEMRDNNPCPDIGLRIQYRIKAVALTKAAIAQAEDKT